MLKVRFIMLRALGVVGVCVATAQSAVLVYENYDYALSQSASMNGVAVDAVGLTGSYSLLNGGSAIVAYQTSGLTFSPQYFPVSGGHVRLYAPGSTFAILGAGLNAGTVSGDLYQSFLFQAVALSATGAGSGAFTRIGAGATTSPGNRLSVSAEANVAGAGPGIGYDGSGGTVADAGSISLNTTYLMLAKFTNVGNALSAGSPGVATFWALTESGYDNWRTLGDGLEANLATYAAFTATDTQTSGTFNFDNASYLQLAGTTTGTGGGIITMDFDEMRFGTSLGSVSNAMIPEPSTLVLLMAGALLIGFRRIKMRRAA